HQYLAATADASSRFEELTPEQRQQLEQDVRNAIDMYVESEGAAADAVVDAAMAVAAIGGAAFCGGVSLSLLAATGIGGAIFRVAARSMIMGGDYDFESMAGIDAAIGAVDGIGTFLGPVELGAMAGIGRAAARSATAAVIRQGGRQLLREGAEELLQQGLTRAVRESVLSGSYRISEETVQRLSRQVAAEGLDEAAQRTLRNLICNSLRQVTEFESIVARNATSAVVGQGGERLLRDGAEELLEQSLTQALRESVSRGSTTIAEQVVDRVAGQVAREGLSDAAQQELRNLISSSIREATQRQSRAALENAAIRYGLNMAGGAFGGGSSGMVRGLAQWDSSRSFADNLEAVGRTALTSAAFGAAGAGTFTAVFDAASPLVRGIREHFRLRPGQELSPDQLHEAARLTGLPDARLRQTSQGDLVLEANAGIAAAAGSGDAPQVRAASRESSPALASGAGESVQDAPAAGSSIHRDSSPALTRASRDTIVDAAPPAGMEEPEVRVAPIRSIGDQPVVTRPIHTIVDSWRTPEAIDASNRFTRNHSMDERLPNGWQYVEQRRFIGPDGVATGRDRMLHSVLVDRNTDPVLRSVIDTARQRFSHLPPAQRAEALQNFVNDLLRPAGMTEEALDTWYASFLRAHDGHRIPLGEFIAHGQGVCSQRAILLKVLGDELGLNFRLIRGSGGANPAEINHVWTEIDLPGQGTRIFDPRHRRAGERAEDFASHYHGSAIDSGAVRPTIIEPIPAVNVRASTEPTARTRDTLPDGTGAWGSVPQGGASGSADVPATAPRDSAMPELGSIPPEQGHGPGLRPGSVPASEIRAIRQELVEGVEMDEAGGIVSRLRTAEDPVISVPMEHLHTVLSEGGISARPTWTGHRLLVGTLGRDAATFGQQRFLVRVINRQIEAMPRATGPEGLFHGVVGFNRDSMRLGQDIEIILPDGTVINGAQ
ncbi:MAG TPA: EDR1-related protein, partial [Candidatus Obscuribacterales bacterium]